VIESITAIPGPTFLVLYAGLAVLGIVAGRILARADGSTSRPMPHLSQLTPYHVAVLQGGWLSLLHTKAAAERPAGEALFGRYLDALGALVAALGSMG